MRNKLFVGIACTLTYYKIENKIETEQAEWEGAIQKHPSYREGRQFKSIQAMRVETLKMIRADWE